MRFQKFLSEKVLRPDMSKIKSHLRGLKDLTQDPQYEEMVDFLVSGYEDFTGVIDYINKKLKLEEIEFVLVKDWSKSGLSGGKNTPLVYWKNGVVADVVGSKIKIYVNHNFLQKMVYNFDEALGLVLALVEHELTHRMQLDKRKGQYIGMSKSEVGRIINKKIMQQNSGRKSYLSSPEEIMAYANQIVSSFKTLGKSDKEILDLIQYPKKYKKELDKLKDKGHGLYQLYINTFQNNDKALKRLRKYIYQILSQ